jgi:hypothetical protein
MSRRIVPTIYYNIGDGFLTNTGNVLRVTNIDIARQTYELKGSGMTPIIDMDQDNLFSMVKYGSIKYLGKKNLEA